VQTLRFVTQEEVDQPVSSCGYSGREALLYKKDSPYARTPPKKLGQSAAQHSQLPRNLKRHGGRFGDYPWDLKEKQTQ
jgi:hypothetical protein